MKINDCNFFDVCKASCFAFFAHFFDLVMKRMHLLVALLLGSLSALRESYILR